ncbi:MAG TPA: RDD family protein [Panacibacter sp.]|nr:RDD family protein [Panacibacter sp.]HNP43480.1 RDD family protein [Panacibacter sp.]
MAVINITTPQNIELEYELASLGDRMVACIIDLLIIIAYCILVSMISSFTRGISGDIIALFYIIVFLPVTFYTLLSELMLNGQTVGKRVMAIKVISLNGNRPAFSQYLIRWLFRLIDLWMFSFVPAVIVIAVTEKHQRVGDLVAGTTLVKTKPKTSLEQTIYVPQVKEDYQVLYPEVINLNDRDMLLVKEVLLNVQKSGNSMLTLQTMQKIEQVLHIRSQHADPRDFLATVLGDYNHLTSKL